MRWEDEPYSKLYTRDTPTWKAMCWQAKALLPLLLRKVDKAGLMECGDLGRSAVALMVDLPEEVVAPGMKDLERLGVAVWLGAVLELPKFEEAQEARKSDILRKRDERSKAKAKARAEALEITQDVSHDVTRRPEVSHEVTLQPSPPRPPSPEQLEASAAADPPLPVRELQEIWNTSAHPSLPRWAETGKKRRAWARARLTERPDLEAWRQVVERINASDFCRGQNDRGWVASPDWLLKAETATKVLEGKYDNRATSPPKRAGGARFVAAQEADHSNAKAGVVDGF